MDVVSGFAVRFGRPDLELLARRTIRDVLNKEQASKQAATRNPFCTCSLMTIYFYVLYIRELWRNL